MSVAEEKAQRELFWYREELLKIVQGRWKEVKSFPANQQQRISRLTYSQANGSRCGDLSLRQQRMTMHMLNTLQTDAARIDLSLVQYAPDDDSPTMIKRRGGKFVVESNTMVNAMVKVTNTGRM
jgi:hypothetical protein